MQGRPRDSVSLAERLRIYDFEVDRAALNVLLLKCRSCAAKRILKVNETLSFIPEDNAAGTTGTST
jgi:hypothetical protein